MPRFPISEKQINGSKAVIGGADYRHIVKVLRLRTGDPVTLFDDSSFEHYGTIAEIGSRELTVKISETRRVNTDSPIRITLLQGLPRGDRMDYIVEKATELGVHTVVPVITERSQVRTSQKKRRWERIAVEASKQCGRTIPTVIEDTLNFIEALNIYNDNALKIILHVNSEASMKEFLNNSLQFSKNIILFIGPEGGFSETEILLSSELGFTSLGLGPRTLRTETASVAVLSIIQFHHGDL
ncbi:MAG: 16S rRNA (uracil(1498)-N(3))-methyltransferase [Deltaproteobacteria bacterium]